MVLRLPPRGLLLASLALLAGLLLYAGLIEPRWVEVTRHDLGTPRPGGRPLRVVQLSDLHLHALGARERRAAELVRAEAPDLLVLTGDLVESAHELPLLDAFLSLLGDPPEVVAVPGNWEHWGSVPYPAVRQVLARHRGRLLVNQVVVGQRDGRRWTVAGLDYPTGSLPATEAARLQGGSNLLLLTHTPAAREHWSGPPAVAMLTGHTHGGQVAPFGLALWVPPGCWGLTAGWAHGPPVDLYVSRGVGTSLAPFRLGARPEVASFAWWLE